MVTYSRTWHTERGASTPHPCYGPVHISSHTRWFGVEHNYPLNPVRRRRMMATKAQVSTMSTAVAIKKATIFIHFVFGGNVPMSTLFGCPGPWSAGGTHIGRVVRDVERAALEAVSVWLSLCDSLMY